MKESREQMKIGGGIRALSKHIYYLLREEGYSLLLLEYPKSDR